MDFHDCSDVCNLVKSKPRQIVAESLAFFEKKAIWGEKKLSFETDLEMLSVIAVYLKIKCLLRKQIFRNFEKEWKRINGNFEKERKFSNWKYYSGLIWK